MNPAATASATSQLPPGASMRLAVVGCGKMAEAMLTRWLEVGALRPDEVVAVVRRADRAQELAGRHGIATSLELATVATADVVVLGIKPQQLATLAPSLRPYVGDAQLWISLLAGTPEVRLQAECPGRWQRWMPNTPCRLGVGATAVCGAAAPAAIAPRLEALLAALGDVHALREDQFDAFTAVAGSGPAYVFAFVEALAAAGTAQGIAPAEAERLARAVVIGAAALLQRDPREAAALRADVTSPGGTTEAALRTLTTRGWSDAMVAAIDAGVARAQELAAAAPPARPG